MKSQLVLTLLLLTTALLTLAFLTYPGSTYYDLHTIHYRFFENTISETGATINYRREALVWSRIFFSAALAVGGITIGLFITQMVKPLLGTLLATVTATCFMLIPFFPSDRFSSIHNYVFFAAVAFTTLSFGIVGISTHSRLTLLSTFLLTGYVIFLVLHPHTTTSPAIHSIHVVFQKLAVLVILLTIAVGEYLPPRSAIIVTSPPKLYH